MSLEFMRKVKFLHNLNEISNGITKTNLNLNSSNFHEFFLIKLNYKVTAVLTSDQTVQSFKFCRDVSQPIIVSSGSRQNPT